MATSGAASAVPKYLHVDAIQTVTPARAAEPGSSRRIAVSEPLRVEALQSHARVVLYYKHAGEEEGGGETVWAVAAWLKETLNAALPAEPLLAGRLRREREAEGFWEVKYNDSGVRMVQATAEMSMEEFLAAKDRESKEAMLAYWVDIDWENPRFSALFYVQVTGFRGGDGYSIGISCSLLLADHVFLIRFLKSWAATHNRMLAQGELSNTPIFHLSYFTRPGRPTHLRSTPLDSTTSSTITNTTTILFKVPQAHGQRPQARHALASLCLGEATRRLESEPVSKFTLIVNDHSGDSNVESCVKEGTPQPDPGFNGALNVAWWDELSAEEIAFGEGNKPIHVSYHIVSCAEEGLVVVTLPSSKDATDLMISATVPKKA